MSRLPDPLTAGVADRLVVTAPTVPVSSATLVAARQLSEEADSHGRWQPRPRAASAVRRRHELRSLLALRRSDLEHRAG